MLHICNNFRVGGFFFFLFFGVFLQNKAVVFIWDKILVTELDDKFLIK